MSKFRARFVHGAVALLMHASDVGPVYFSFVLILVEVFVYAHLSEVFQDGFSAVYVALFGVKRAVVTIGEAAGSLYFVIALWA